MSLHVLLFHFADKFLELSSFHAFMPTLWINVYLSQRFRHFSIVETVEKRVRKKNICFQKIKFGSKPFSISQVTCIVIKQFHSTFFEILHLANFKIYFFKLPFQMFIFFADCLFSEKMSSWLIFRFHLRVSSILKFINLIFEILLVLFKFIIEHNVFLELIFIIIE